MCLLFIQNKKLPHSNSHRNHRQAFQQSRSIPGPGISCTKGEGVEDGAVAVATTEIGQQLGGRRELGKRVLSLGGCPSSTFNQQVKVLLLHGP